MSCSVHLKVEADPQNVGNAWFAGLHINFLGITNKWLFHFCNQITIMDEIIAIFFSWQVRVPFKLTSNKLSDLN
jgi:hypothetical protein